MAEKTLIKVSFERLKELDNIYGRLLRDENLNFAQTKLGYAFKRFSDVNLKKIFNAYNEELFDIRIENALTDEKGAVLYQSDNKDEFQMSKEGLRKSLKQAREAAAAWDEKEFEVEPYVCLNYDENMLTEAEKEVLQGLVI